MQRSTATIRLAGDMLNTVVKTGLSPAEIVILRHIHGGPDTVVDIQPNFMDKTPHAQERERLENIYRPDVVDTCFPGKFNKLPVSLKEIAVEGDAFDDPAEEIAEQIEAMPPAEGVEPGPVNVLSDELELDDKELVDRIMAATSKKELTELAEENEVDLTGRVSAKVDEIKQHIVKSLFPNYKF